MLATALQDGPENIVTSNVKVVPRLLAILEESATCLMVRANVGQSTLGQHAKSNVLLDCMKAFHLCAPREVTAPRD